MWTRNATIWSIPLPSSSWSSDAIAGTDSRDLICDPPSPWGRFRDRATEPGRSESRSRHPSPRRGRDSPAPTRLFTAMETSADSMLHEQHSLLEVNQE